jgi:hypothetical protein
MNTLGIALAADSAVTISGPRGQKIYNSADKLFQLCEDRPVGIMFYGNAGLLGVPWETLVKEFRRTSSTATSIDGIAEDFTGFIEKNVRRFFSDGEQLHVVRRHTSVLMRRVVETIKESVKGIDFDRPLSEREVESRLRLFVRDAVRKVAELVTGHKVLDRAVPKRTLRTKYGAAVAKGIDSAAAELPLSRAQRAKLVDLVLEALRRNFAVANSVTGLVFAGFADGSLFPSLVEVKVEGIVANKLRVLAKNGVNISHEQRSVVVPFAQSEMVHAFMEGIDPRVRDFTQKIVETFLQGFPEQVLKDVPALSSRQRSAVTRALSSAVVPATKVLWESLARQRRVEYAVPVAQVVSHLPKDELAAMAEALVNLTSFRRRVSPDAETVGGPIDVAVISRGDGFVWIKRKHYFSPELNPRHMARYQVREGNR